MLATLAVIFVLVLIFSSTRYPEWLKGLIMTFSFLAILADVGAWWPAKLAAFAAPLVILGGWRSRLPPDRSGKSSKREGALQAAASGNGLPPCTRYS